jgi:hypothetical protein
MLDATTMRDPLVVADFAAGDGALLSAASELWPTSTVLANEVDRRVAARLKRTGGEKWLVSVCDFLDDRSLNRSRLRLFVDRCSLVLLNPPFSYRGTTAWEAKVAGTAVTCSPALAFIAKSIPMMDEGGELVAIIPDGSFTAKKDAAAWELLSSSYAVDRLTRYGRDAFPGCYPRTSLVRIRARLSLPASPDARKDSANEPGRHPWHVSIVRGWIPMYTVKSRTNGERVPLVHTTDLRGARLKQPGRMVRSTSILRGPAVLLQRVGEPSILKICVLPSAQQVALSDCVIALLTDTMREADLLRAELRRSWRVVESAYGGTCAKYITREQVRMVLRKCGVNEVEFLRPAEAVDSSAST